MVAQWVELQELIDEVVPVLTTLFDISLSSGIVPTAFKQAIIKPVLKKTGLDANELKNFRPVSNLPFLPNILEKVVLARLSKHLFFFFFFTPSTSLWRVYSHSVHSFSTMNPLSHSVSIVPVYKKQKYEYCTMKLI